MKLEVNPTRMELLKLKKRLVLAQRGHKLLKDKQDELMKHLLEAISEIRSLRQRVEAELTKVNKRFLFAVAGMSRNAVEESFLLPGMKATVEVERTYLMNVRIPIFKYLTEGKIHCYGFVDTSGELDASLVYLEKILKDLFELAAKEKTIELLADELEKTRRRVNALEYVLIPNIEDTIRYITMKLAEIERSDLSRLMRVKEIVRAH